MTGGPTANPSPNFHVRCACSPSPSVASPASAAEHDSSSAQIVAPVEANRCETIFIMASGSKLRAGGHAEDAWLARNDRESVLIEADLALNLLVQQIPDVRRQPEGTPW